MQIIVTEWCREWRGIEPQGIHPYALPLAHQNALFALTVMLANGEFDDVCFEGACADAIEAIRGLLIGTGEANRVEQHFLADSSRLCRGGYEIYVQDNRSVFFVNPTPRPELFQENGLASYALEYTK